MDEDAALGQARVLVDRVDRPQAQDVARIDRVGIADPGLDRGDRELARPGFDRRPWRGRRAGRVLARIVELALPGQGRALFGAAVPQIFLELHRAQHGFEPQQPARRHGGRALDPRGPGQHHLARAEALGEIMRRRADAPLGRGQAEIPPHRPRQPGIAVGAGRPHALVQAAEHHEIGLLQARLEQAPDEQARMAAIGGPHHHAAQERFEQRGIIRSGQAAGIPAAASSSPLICSAAASPASPRQRLAAPLASSLAAKASAAASCAAIRSDSAGLGRLRAPPSNATGFGRCAMPNP